MFLTLGKDKLLNLRKLGEDATALWNFPGVCRADIAMGDAHLKEIDSDDSGKEMDSPFPRTIWCSSSTEK